MNGPTIALCSAAPIALDGVDAPEWIQLLPAGEIRTQDGRGPYRVADMTALMAASLPAGERLVVDENHATDLAAPKGESAPARGWIVELQARQGALWGRVEWTTRGRQMVADREYRGISPAILHNRAGVISNVLRASLINTPNLIGMASLHAEGHQDMDWKSLLIELLGLDSGASDDDIAAALKKRLEPAGDPDEAALQGAQHATIVALQGEIAALANQLNAVTADQGRRAAEAFIDEAIRAGRVGIKPVRDHYIALHMRDPQGTAALIAALPTLHGTRLTTEPPSRDDPAALGAADQQVIALMGLDPEAYKATRASRMETL